MCGYLRKVKHKTHGCFCSERPAPWPDCRRLPGHTRARPASGLSLNDCKSGIERTYCVHPARYLSRPDADRAVRRYRPDRWRICHEHDDRIIKIARHTGTRMGLVSGEPLPSAVYAQYKGAKHHRATDFLDLEKGLGAARDQYPAVNASSGKAVGKIGSAEPYDGAGNRRAADDRHDPRGQRDTDSGITCCWAWGSKGKRSIATITAPSTSPSPR